MWRIGNKKHRSTFSHSHTHNTHREIQFHSVNKKIQSQNFDDSELLIRPEQLCNEIFNPFGEFSLRRKNKKQFTVWIMFFFQAS